MCFGDARYGVFTLLLAAASWVVWVDVARALDVLGYAPERHDRFYQPEDPGDPAKAFIGDDYSTPLDFSGVGRRVNSNGTFSNWATMISDTYFVNASHFETHEGDTVRFYRDNDLSGDYWEGQVLTTEPIDSSDLAIGQLSEAPPSWVARYPLIKRQEGTNYLSLSSLDPEVILVGHTQPQIGNTTYNTRVGRNELVGYSSSDTVRFEYDTGPSGLGNDEATKVPGDSGSPSFALVGSNLAVVMTQYSANIGTSVSSYLDKILPAIPEPVEVITDILGDLNGDYKVNLLDQATLGSNWQQGPGVRYNEGDLNNDGYVNLLDSAILGGNWQKTLFAPSDFNQDERVDADDMKMIGNNWLDTVSAGSPGDANSDGVVNHLDVNILNDNWRFGTFFFPTPFEIVPGDINEDGLVNNHDLAILNDHWQQEVDPFTNGDLNGDAFVDILDQATLVGNWDPFGPADITEDLFVDTDDLATIIEHWHQATVAGKAEGDIDNSGFVDATDFATMADWWGLGYPANQMPPLVPAPEPAGWLLVLLVAGRFGLRRPCRANRT